MKKFLFGASALLALSTGAMAEPAALSDGQLGGVAAGELAWSLVATNIVSNTLTNTTTNAVSNTVTRNVGQSLTGGAASNNYNVALSSTGAFATGGASTSVVGTIVGAP